VGATGGERGKEAKGTQRRDGEMADGEGERREEEEEERRPG
jgi:hypothetical protein